VPRSTRSGNQYQARSVALGANANDIAPPIPPISTIGERRVSSSSRRMRRSSVAFTQFATTNTAARRPEIAHCSG
jgi:hypothetical protein